ncbi:CDP-diacylglycerol--serine O-phosphatidyltransferase [Candidatus Riesia pediculischaeffi]|uniref:PLD phosphodiesterase domain-containing protein n=1 Tax=Candidatus Riesia pediculischaeffi TaxID=428411 RepID=A0A1V0HK97_9ENTR|nr:CDP-diacylglycerol--serine O-phosphatidyltransferase [Candidatus Riesia pediculischaeffi]ARC53245.1 hypothetical protein AOQ87_00875 [Candidatus Riesia pediculischaeffi]
MLTSIKNNLNYHKSLTNLKKLPQIPSDMITLYRARSFRKIILEKIKVAKKHIYIPVLYFEKDDSGKEVFEALSLSKKREPDLDIKIMVDWYRAKRNRIGESNNQLMTNKDWYRLLSLNFSNHEIRIFGIPVGMIEIFGTFHLKGIIIDDSVIYSGASISNLYFHKEKRHRYDRYHMFHNADLAKIMKNFIDKEILRSPAVQRYDIDHKFIKFRKRYTNQFRKRLKKCHYQFKNIASNEELSVCPIIGMGRRNYLNRTILNLMGSTKRYMTICTPYFNLPVEMIKMIRELLTFGKRIEIIVGDKTTNDFYVDPKKRSFRWINILPYLYEINLRDFVNILQRFVNNRQLIIRHWKYDNHSYHLKGIWIDSNWQLITGNNFNRRSWYFDLENAILIHDPMERNSNQIEKEMRFIQLHTRSILHYEQIENICSYPEKVQRRIDRIHRTKMDRLIKMVI